MPHLTKIHAVKVIAFSLIVLSVIPSASESAESADTLHYYFYEGPDTNVISIFFDSLSFRNKPLDYTSTIHAHWYHSGWDPDSLEISDNVLYELYPDCYELNYNLNTNNHFVVMKLEERQSNEGYSPFEGLWQWTGLLTRETPLSCNCAVTCLSFEFIFPRLTIIVNRNGNPESLLPHRTEKIRPHKPTVPKIALGSRGLTISVFTTNGYFLSTYTLNGKFLYGSLPSVIRKNRKGEDVPFSSFLFTIKR